MHSVLSQSLIPFSQATDAEERATKAEAALELSTHVSVLNPASLQPSTFSRILAYTLLICRRNCSAPS